MTGFSASGTAKAGGSKQTDYQDTPDGRRAIALACWLLDLMLLADERARTNEVAQADSRVESEKASSPFDVLFQPSLFHMLCDCSRRGGANTLGK